MTEFRKQADARRKEKRHDALMDAGAAVFASRGYHRTLVSEIVARAGAGQGTFYRYFRDKRDLFEALADRFVESMFGEFAAMSDHLPQSSRDYRDASVAAIRRIAALAERDHGFVQVIVREGPTVDEAFERKLADLYERLATLAQFYLDHAIRSGFARPCDTRVVSRAVVGMAVWMSQQWLGGRLDGVTLERLIDEMVDFAFGGFGAPAGAADGGVR